MVLILVMNDDSWIYPSGFIKRDHGKYPTCFDDSRRNLHSLLGNREIISQSSEINFDWVMLSVYHRFSIGFPMVLPSSHSFPMVFPRFYPGPSHHFVSLKPWGALRTWSPERRPTSRQPWRRARDPRPGW